MSIEHRWAPRHAAGLPVSIACRLGLLTGRLNNISNGGALVQLQTPIPPNVPVEFILPARPGSNTEPYRLPAIVIRCGASEIGLMFDRIDPETWAALVSRVARSVPDAEQPPASVANAHRARKGR